jgi:CheY-like chemotaxis protein
MTKILLVEDDKSLREIYGVRLLAEGYDIVSAGDGEEALAMAIKEKPTLIISDVMMPKISGFDMLDILRSTTETRDIKVIMMTALSSEDQRARGEQLGADRYLVKSQVGIEDIVRTIHEVLGDAPASTDASAPAASTTAPAVPETPATAEEAKPAEEAAPAEPVTESVSAASSSTSSSNATAGPLPPQPTELESTLPQPTAPFSSPRPSNLGEQVVHPGSEVSEVAPAASPDLNSELSAPTEPVVASQVDEAAPLESPAPVTPEITAPVVTPPVEEISGLSTPIAPETPHDDGVSPVTGASNGTPQ